MYKLSLHIICSYTFCYKVLSPRRQTPNRLSVFSVFNCRYSVFFGIVNTSMSVSVFQNIGYRFAISVYRPKTTLRLSHCHCHAVSQSTPCTVCSALKMKLNRKIRRYFYLKDGAAFFKSEGATVIYGPPQTKSQGAQPPAPGSDAYECLAVLK